MSLSEKTGVSRTIAVAVSEERLPPAIPCKYSLNRSKLNRRFFPVVMLLSYNKYVMSINTADLICTLYYVAVYECTANYGC